MDQALNEIIVLLKEFLDECVHDPQGFPRRWLRHSNKVAQAYVKIGIYGGVRCLEIADVQFGGPMWNNPLTKDEYAWTEKFLEMAHDINTQAATAVTNVVDNRLAGYLLTNLWTVGDVSIGSVNYFIREKNVRLGHIKYHAEKVAV